MVLHDMRNSQKDEKERLVEYRKRYYKMQKNINLL